MQAFTVIRKVRTGEDSDRLVAYVAHASDGPSAIRMADTAKARDEAALGLIDPPADVRPPLYHKPFAGLSKLVSVS